MDWNIFFGHPLTQITIIIVIAYLLHRFAGNFLRSLVHRIMLRHRFETMADRNKQEQTIASIFHATASILIWCVAIGAILSVLDFDFAKIAAGAGFLGIIIGLGAQATIRDYLAGIFILLEGQYRVGDVVTLNGGNVSQETSGVVEDITLRITKLRDLDGTLNIIRNGEASIVTNRTYKYSSIVIDIGVTYDSDIDAVEKVMNSVGKDMLKETEFMKDIKEPIQFLRVDDFADSAIVIKALGKVSPAKQWDIAGAYRRRILKAFKKADIDIAFPQLVIHNQSTSK